MDCVFRITELGSCKCTVCGVDVQCVSCSCHRNCDGFQPETPAPPTHGPGTELKKLLAGWPLYITASPDCPCNARAAEMDRHGVEWCETNIDTIVEWLREQATARGLPFLDVAGRLLVRRAIANARRNA